MAYCGNLFRAVASPWGMSSSESPPACAGHVEPVGMQDEAGDGEPHGLIGIAHARRQSAMPSAAIIVCGGGRKNPALLYELSVRTQRPVITAERAGWRGDAIEAEAFAYLAARTLKGLPISFPGTTGVGMPMAGGVVAQP